MAKHRDSESNRKEKTTLKKRGKLYLKPELIIYGHVEKLTEGSTGALGDGGATKRPK